MTPNTGELVRLRRTRSTVPPLLWLLFGGLTIPENLLTVCEDCHSLIHARLLFGRGTIPAGLRFLDSNGQDLRTLGRTLREVVERMVVVSRETHETGQASDQPRNVSRETPRVALALLHTVRDETELRGLSVIDLGITSDVLRSLQIDDGGLGRLDREYLEVLHLAGRPLGLGTLADRLGKSRNSLQTVHEPFLIRRGLIVRTPRGRMLVA